ncbi:type I-F CRISPR-associated protein Csy1 [Erwinia psidii]|uniref:type I-F CRISPR-associated protein Csy1 n=1 Tax=Erwinia psidii TaxID=69224 RepID=UPI00226B23A1|nr:type I-F CRISPR-associated protein Csy1 [Erwinia psidii]MCX8960874.1 type I-F CRISPR-associated protein Csy1 [Erwinia psidii]
MADEGFTLLITAYIRARGQPKLEAFDKAAEKTLAELSDSAQISLARQNLASQRRELEQRYEVQRWLSDAASRAGQISLVTHALKFTHSDAKGSSRFEASSGQTDAHYLSTATLHKPSIDAVGNAAALDVAKLLQIEYQGESLIAALSRGDYSPLAPLAESEQQLTAWVEGFQQVLHDRQASSHKLAKQLYFPVGDNQYHLLGPLFSSSLAHALHQRIVEARFSDNAKEINAAFREKRWHSAPRIGYLNMASQNPGGSRPQNISYLNSVRGGRSWLLSCAAPVWHSQPVPPVKHTSVFNRYSAFSQMARSVVWQLREFLLRVKGQPNNMEIRQRRLAYTDEIIDMLFNYAAGVQHDDMQQGWSAQDACQLKRSQQLWLDPGRAKGDEQFCAERERGEWQKELAVDFGLWLNRQLKHKDLNMSETERREWSTASLFKQRLREFEQAVKEEWQ